MEVGWSGHDYVMRCAGGTTLFQVLILKQDHKINMSILLSHTFLGYIGLLNTPLHPTEQHWPDCDQ